MNIVFYTVQPHCQNCQLGPVLAIYKYKLRRPGMMPTKKTRDTRQSREGLRDFPDQHPPNKGMEVQRRQVAQGCAWQVGGRFGSGTHTCASLASALSSEPSCLLVNHPPAIPGLQ